LRRLLTIAILFTSLSAGAARIYISPSGNDGTGNGSIGSPYFTLGTAWSHISTGDTIYCRGGTYAYTATNTLSNKSGAADSLIYILNYPGEKPVFDYSGGVPYASQRIGFSMTNVSYIHIKGIRVTGITQPEAGTIAMYGMLLWNNVTHATFELMEFDRIGGWGVTIGDNCSDVLFLNCDSHHHQDPYSVDTYGWSDGFQTGSLSSTDITFDGCRAWSNADDGWDFRGANGIYTLRNCWAFRNGYIPGTWDTAGNGVGFKMGGKSTASTTDILRHVSNCVAFENRMIGFNLGAADANKCLGAEFYHCTAYNNYQGFNVNSYTNNATIRNSLSYLDSGGAFYGNAYTIHDHNSFDIPLTLTSGDFISTDTTGVSGARQSNGSPPVLNFLKITSTSNLKDAGYGVGVMTDGSGNPRGYLPDLGAYEIEDIRVGTIGGKAVVGTSQIYTIRK